MESIFVEHILSRSRLCLHTFDFVRGVFSGAAFCSCCQFANTYLRTRRYCYSINAPILSLRSFGERFGISITLVERKLEDLIRHHDSLSAYERFYFPSDHDVSHIHGVVSEESHCEYSGVGSSGAFEHPVGDWCLSPSVGCDRGQKMELAGVVHTISEGSPSTSYATTCTKCSATVWHAGLGGQIILLDLLHFMKVDWDYSQEVFGISFIDGRYFQEISTFTAACIWKVAEWCFTGPAQEIMLYNSGFRALSPAVANFRSPRVSKKVEKGVFKLDTRSDSFGVFQCGDTKDPHSWKIIYPNIHLSLEFPPEVSFLVDHLMYPRIVGRGRPGRACRAYGMWGIPDYAPRFNQAYLDSVRKRKILSEELDAIVGFEGTSDDEYESVNSDDPQVRISGRGDAEMEQEILPEVMVPIFDEASGEYYFITHDGETKWMEDATAEDWKELHLDEENEDFFGLNSENLPILNEEDDNERVPKPLGYAEERAELVETSCDEESEQGDEQISQCVDKSVKSSVGSLLVDFAKVTESLGRVTTAPAAALNHSISNFGRWLAGNEKHLTNYRAGDFPVWVNGDFKNVVGRLGAELSKSQETILETLNAVDEFRTDVLQQFKRIHKLMKKLTKQVKEVTQEGLTDEVRDDLRKFADRLDLAELHLSAIVEKQSTEDDLELSAVVRGLEKKVRKMEGLEADILKLNEKLIFQKKMADVRYQSLKKRIDGKQVEEPAVEEVEEKDNFPVGGPAYAILKPKKSYAMARGIPQMEQLTPEIQTDKPDSVLPVNPDLVYQASASKAGDHVAGVSPDLDNMTSSRYLIEEFKWNVTDNEHVAINSIHFPGELFEACPWLKNTSLMFQYFRCNGLELTVTMTSNMMQGGVLFVGWDSMSTCERRSAVTIYEYYNLPHGLMTAGKDAELTFNVGFDAIQERMSLAGFELGLIGIGSLVFVPLNGLVCPAQTSQYCEIGVYCKLKAPDFQVRTVIHEYKQQFDINSLAQVITDPGQQVLERNPERSMDIVGKNLIHTGKWAATNHGRLFSLNVHPCFVKKLGRNMYPTALAMVSSLFHFWRGSLKYTFIFGGNQLTTGKLHVCAIPGQFITEAPPSKIVMGVGGRVINLKDGDTHFEFTVPFYGVGDKQRVCRHTLFDSMYYGEDLVTRLHVWVVDPLITNIGATSSLSFAVVVEPGPDFELMCPRGIQSGLTRSLRAEGLVANEIQTQLSSVPGYAYDLFPNWGHLMFGTFKSNKGMRFKVAPMYAGQQVDMNVLSWISNYYTRWSGTLEYKFVCKPHQKNLHKFVYFWHMYEDPHFEAEFGYEAARLPPSGVPSVRWDLSSSAEFVISVPFQSRFNSLAIPLSALGDIKYHPTFYYNGVVHGSYYGTEDVDFNVYIRACPDYRLYGHGAMTVIATKGGDVSLSYIPELISVEETPVNRKNVPLQVVKDLFEDLTDDDEDLEGSEEEKEALEKPAEAVNRDPPPVETPRASSSGSGRGKPQMEDGVFGKWAAKKLFGEDTAANLAKIDSDKVAKMVNWSCEASKFDFESLSGLVQKLVPLAETLNKRAEEAKVFTDEGAKSLSFLGELSEMGGKMLELIKQLYKSSSLGWLAAQYDDGKMTLAVVGTIALFIVGILWWRQRDSMNWVTKVGSIIAILWAPEIGAKSLDLYTWIVQKLRGVSEVRDQEKAEGQSCHEAASSSLQSTISARGMAQMELDFLDGMTDYAETILSAILMIGSLFCLSMMPSDKTIGSWTKTLSGLGDKARAFTSIGSLLAMLQKWGKVISDSFMGWMVKLRGQKLIGDDAQLSAMMKFGVAEWVKRVSDLCLEEEKYKNVNDLKKIEEIRALYDKGQAIKEAMLTHSFGAGTAAVFRDTINKVEKLINETYSSKGLGEPRIDPIHIAFVGKPGVGKSAVVQTFTKNLLDYMKYPQKDRIYSRSCADAFWSRYCRQPVVLYDDLGALTGDATFSDYGEFINLKANVPYALNMAAVEEKGAMFQSHFLVSTSNAFFLDNNSNVRNPEAFYRRRDLSVIIERNPEVPMNPSDPTEGLLFSIVDTFTGSGRFTWPNWMGIEDGTFSLMRVPYREFMVFTMKYTKGYMRNQQALLKTFKANYLGEDETTELEVEKLLADLVAQRGGSDSSPPISGDEGESDEDFWGARAIDDVMGGEFPGAATMFPARGPQGGQARNRGQRNPRDGPGRFEAQMLDRYVTEDNCFYSTLELIGMYSKWEITGEHLAKSLQGRFGTHFESLYSNKSTSMLSQLESICTCTQDSLPVECDGLIFWDTLKTINAIYIPSPDGKRAAWLTSQVSGLNAKYRINFVPQEPWMIFCGLIQAVRLYTKHWGCPGQIFNSVDLMRTVEESCDDEDDFVDSYELFPPAVYANMPMEDGIHYYDRDDFKGTYPIVCGVFGGIPIKFGGHEVFLGKKENRRPGDVTEEEYLWVREELTKKSCARILESLLPAFNDMDIILMKQVLQGFTGHLCAVADYKHCGSLGFVGDRLGWNTYGMVVFYMLIATKEGINRRVLKKKQKAQQEARRIAEGLDVVKKEQMDLVSSCSGWMRKALVFGGLVGAGIAAGLAVWGLWRGISGFFGFIWGSFGSKADTKEVEETKPIVQNVVPQAVTPILVSTAEVVKQRYDGTDLEMQAGTYGNSGDQKTRYVKKYGARTLVRSRNIMKKGAAQVEVSDLGIVESGDGFIDAVQSEALAHLKVAVAKEVGVSVETSDVVKAQLDLKSRVLETIDEWQRRLLGFNRVKEPKRLRADGVACADDSKIVIVKGNTPFLVEKNVDPDWKGVFLAGRSIDEEVLIDKALVKEMAQPAFESLQFYHLEAQVGDEVERTTLQAEGGGTLDKNLMENVNVYENAMVQCLTVDSKVRFFGVMIVGSWLLIPAHFLMRTQPGEEIVLLSVKGVHRMRLNVASCFLVSQYQDLALVDLGPRCPMWTDIRKHFMTCGDLLQWRRSPGLLMHVSYSKVGRRVVHQFCGSIDNIDAQTQVATTVYDMIGAGDHVNVSGFKYPAMTGVGWCGSLLVSGKPGATRRLLGIHTAGHTEFAMGYAEMVTVEALDAVLNHPTHRVHAALGEGQMGIERLLCNDKPLTTRKSKRLRELGVVKKELVPLAPSKTDIIRSPIHGLYGKVQTEPSILSPFDRRLKDRFQADGVGKWGSLDPLLDAVEKYGEKTHSFPSRKIAVIESFLKTHYGRLENSVKRRNLLSEDECINGIEFNDSYLPLNMDTSPGWPSVLKRKKGTYGKKFLFEQVESVPNGRARYKLIDDDVRASMIRKESSAMQGQHDFLLTVECSKDERRKKKKIYEEVATRSFTNLDVAQNLLYRKYFLNFGVMVQENFSRSFCKVGINVNGPEWSELVQSWMEKSSVGFAGDYAKFDGIGDPDIFMSICRVVNDWYGDGEENARVREYLLYDAFHRVSLVRNVAVEIDQGMPSGFPMTVIFNSIVNFYFLGMAWCDILRVSNYARYATPEAFWELCGIATYGDDNVVAVPPEILEFYNLRTVARWLKGYGISYTDDQKRPIDESEPSVPIREVTFLKRGIREIVAPMLVVAAPLDKVSVEEQGHWIRSGPTDDEYALRQNLANALYEASLHGREYFLDLKGRLDTALDLVHLAPTETTYLSCQQRFWSYHFNDAVSVEDLSALIEKDMFSDNEKWSALQFNLNKEAVSLEELYKRSKQMKDEFFDLDF